MTLRDRFFSAIAIATLGAAFLFSGCSKSGTTILSLTIASPTGLGMVGAIKVTFTPASGTPWTETINDAPHTTDETGANLNESFYRRFNVPSGVSGATMIDARASNAAGNQVASGTASTEIVEHEATAAFVRLMRPAPPDGGTDGGGADGASDGGADAADGASDGASDGSAADGVDGAIDAGADVSADASVDASAG